MADPQNSYAAFTPSDRPAPPGRRLDAVDPNTLVTISIYLKRRDTVVSDTRENLSVTRRRDHVDDIARVTAFADTYGLAVAAILPGRRLIRLLGTAAQAQAAFRTDLSLCEADGIRFRGREGALQLPVDLHDIVEAVLGLDTRPAAQHRHVRATAVSASFRPDQVASLYGFPAATGAGQCIGLIELGGGYRHADIAASFHAMGLAAPRVFAVSVDGGNNRPTPDDGADTEVALDIQVAGGAAPGATIAVYFAPNTDAGFVDAICTAAHDTHHAPDILSISWGSAETNWSAQAVSAMNSALQDAATLGLSVFVAAGDNLATDSVDDGRAHVDFPASSPNAIGCGGTRLAASNGHVSSEDVWNDGATGTGGGISALFGIPAFQQHTVLPDSVSTGRSGRGVPDVAADASPETGYDIVVNGRAGVVGGTSAVAPLWAGLTARLNQRSGRKLGFFLPALYAKPGVLRQITTGTNKPRDSAIGYDAGTGWNACTGLGVPDANIIDLA